MDNPNGASPESSAVHIWQVSESEFWIGPGDAEQVRAAYIDRTGEDCKNPLTGEPDYPTMLSGPDLDSMHVSVFDDNENTIAQTRSFREAFDARLAVGVTELEFFAMVDW